MAPGGRGQHGDAPHLPATRMELRGKTKGSENVNYHVTVMCEEVIDIFKLLSEKKFMQITGGKSLKCSVNFIDF